jgi:hypothetical protein
VALPVVSGFGVGYRSDRGARPEVTAADAQKLASLQGHRASTVTLRQTTERSAWRLELCVRPSLSHLPAKPQAQTYLRRPRPSMERRNRDCTTRARYNLSKGGAGWRRLVVRCVRWSDPWDERGAHSRTSGVTRLGGCRTDKRKVRTAEGRRAWRGGTRIGSKRTQIVEATVVGIYIRVPWRKSPNPKRQQGTSIGVRPFPDSVSPGPPLITRYKTNFNS